MEREHVINTVKKHIDWLEDPPEYDHAVDIARCIRECLGAYLREGEKEDARTDVNI